VRLGETVQVGDHIAPPYILSSEGTGNEITWSKGEYLAGSAVWQAFGLPGRPPSPAGIYLNQPSPYAGKVAGMWAMFAWMMVALLGLMLFFAVFSRKETVLREARRFSTLDTGEPSFVTQEFELTGRPATLELAVDTNLRNNWAYFNFALINEDTRVAYDFGREVSFYSGRDSDGDWTEGSPQASVLLPAVPPGRYYLRVEPEMDTGTAANLSGAVRAAAANTMSFEITLRHDVPSYIWFFVAGALMLIPPIVRTARARAFEARRWAESDYAPSSDGDDSDDED
jgi:hypothetical protein